MLCVARGTGHSSARMWHLKGVSAQRLFMIRLLHVRSSVYIRMPVGVDGQTGRLVGNRVCVHRA